MAPTALGGRSTRAITTRARGTGSTGCSSVRTVHCRVVRDTAEVDQTEDLQQLAAVTDAVRASEAQLREAVEVARARGRSWNEIAVALGVSRQAARQRFSGKAPA